MYPASMYTLLPLRYYDMPLYLLLSSLFLHVCFSFSLSPAYSVSFLSVKFYTAAAVAFAASNFLEGLA